MRVMAFSDTHLPFDHPNYIKFLRDVKKGTNPDEVVLNGDFVDHYALSRFTLDPDVQGQKPEWQNAMRHAAKYYELFNDVPVTWVIGNHDERPYRKAVEIGLGELYLKKLHEIYRIPDNWKVVPFTTIDGVYYTHGVACGGQNGWQNYSSKLNQSVVVGHIHSAGGVRYHMNPRGEQLFSLILSSGVDDKAYAFAYGKNSPVKSMLGCGLVVGGTKAQFIPMDMSNRNYRRIR